MATGPHQTQQAPEPPRDALREVLTDLREVAARRRGTQPPPTCFVSYAWGDPADTEWVIGLAEDLWFAGVAVVLDRWHNLPGTDLSEYVDRIGDCDWVLVIGTPEYRDKANRKGPVLAEEQTLVRNRFRKEGGRRILPVLRRGEADDVFASVLQGSVFAELRDDADYPAHLLRLTLAVHGIPLEAPEVARWSEALGLRDLAPPPLPPSGGPAPPRHDLPPDDREPFVGREREIAAVAELLAEHSLVTLAGFGGSGKTRLAIQVAHRVLDRFPDGVRLVELAELKKTEGDLVPQALARAWGLEEEAGTPPAEALARHLSDRRALLVLDNCEHVVDACARTVKFLQDRCPVKVLATSRAILRVGGERVFDVPPLETPPPDARTVEELSANESVRLFVETVGRLPQRNGRAELRLDAANAQAIARICRRLEGIPLAIELAAARFENLSLERIAAHLDQTLRLLKGGRRTDARRHRTIRATLDWSHDLLAEDAKALLARLSVFAGEACFDDVVAVCAEDPLDELDIDDALKPLVNNSLVRRREADGKRRYWMHEVVRQYSRELLGETGKEEELFRRHRDRYLELAGRASPHLLGAEQGRWLDRLDAEHANLRQALTYSLEEGHHREALVLGADLWRFWEIRSYLSEGRERLRTLLELPAEGNEALWARVASGAGTLAYRQGDLDEADRLARRALELERRLGNDPGVANALNDLGLVAGRRGRTEEALALYRESLELKRRTDDDREMGVAHNNVGKNLLDPAKSMTEAREHLEEALTRFRRVRDAWDTGFPLQGLGLIALFEGDAEEARRRFTESLEVRSRRRHQAGMAAALTGLALTEVWLGDPVEASEHLEQALRLRTRVGDRPGTVETLEAVAHWAAAQEKTGVASELWTATRSFREREGLPAQALLRPAHERLAATLSRQPAGHGTSAAPEEPDLDAAVERAFQVLAGGPE